MRECCALHDDLYPDARPSNFRELRALRKKRRERHEKNPLTITTDQENQRLADRRFYECMLHRADQGKTKSRRVGMKLQAKLYYGIVRSAGWIFY